MTHRLLHSSMIAVAAALMIGVTSESRAQSPDTTKKATAKKPAASTTKKTAAKPVAKPATSAERIKITKETSGGEVVPAKPADTTVIVRDTTTRMVDTTARVDTMTPVKVDSTPQPIKVMTVDTTPPMPATPEPPPVMRPKHFGNFYVGLGGGASVPSGDIYNGYNPGFNISVPMGWQPPGSLFGLRLDVVYDRLSARPTFRNNGQSATLVTLNNGAYTTSGTATYTPSSGTSSSATPGSGFYNGLATVANNDAALVSAMLDGKLKLPVFGSRSAASFYAVGGGGIHYFLNYAKSLALTNPAAEQAKFAALHQAIDAAAASGTPYSSASYTSSGYSSITRLGVNAGGGFQYSMGAKDLFLEGRYVNVFTKDRSTTYWPVVLGVTWR